MIKQIVILIQPGFVSNKYRTNKTLATSVCHITKKVSIALGLIEKSHTDLLIIEVDNRSELLVDLVSYVADISYSTKILVIAKNKLQKIQEIYLSSGADFFLCQPISDRCLEIYCRNLLNYSKHKIGTLLYLGDVALQAETAHLYVGSHFVQLRKREAEILTYFFRHKNQVITRNMLIDGVWGYCDVIPEYTTIDVYIRRLRMQLKNTNALLETIRGVGYIAREFSHTN